MILEVSILNDNAISVGELKKFLSTIPDNYNLVTNGLYTKRLSIHTDKENGACEIKLENE